MRTQQVISDVLEPLEKIQQVKAGTVLFREGEEARGIYYVRSGGVELLYTARAGDAKPLRSIAPGTILGLSCVVSNKRHDCSATAKTTAEVGFVDRDRLQKLLEERPDAWLTVLQLISTEVSSCWDCMKSLGRC